MHGGLALTAKSAPLLRGGLLKTALKRVHPHPTVMQRVAVTTAWVIAILSTP